MWILARWLIGIFPLQSAFLPAQVRLLYRRRSIADHAAHLPWPAAFRGHLRARRGPLPAPAARTSSFHNLIPHACTVVINFVCSQVKNAEARKGGLDVSLFRRLSEAHPEAVVDLRFQYRMNADIMTLSNRLIYNDRLQCGNDEVANAALRLEDRSFLAKLHGSSNGREGDRCLGADACWLEGLSAERYVQARSYCGDSSADLTCL